MKSWLKKLCLLAALLLAPIVAHAQTVVGFDGTNIYWNNNTGVVIKTQIVGNTPVAANVAILPSAADTGSAANTYAACPSPAPASLTPLYNFTMTTTRPNTGATTLNLCGFGAISIKTMRQQTLTGGEITGSGSSQNLQFIYDGLEWLLAGSGTPGNAALAASNLNLNGASFIGVPVTGELINWGGLTLVGPAMNSAPDNRQMLNFFAPNTGGGFAWGGLGLDYDGVFIIGGVGSTVCLCDGFTETFSNFNILGGVATTDNLDLSTSAPTEKSTGVMLKISGADAIIQEQIPDDAATVTKNWILQGVSSTTATGFLEHPIETGWVSCTQATPCASSGTTVATSQASADAQYEIDASVACTSATSTATAILAVTYTDPSGTTQTLTLSTATCTTLGANSVASLTKPVRIQANTNVQYSVTAANSPNYEASVAVYQESRN